MTMMTSSGWAGAVSAPLRQLNFSASVAWSQATASGIGFFTIGQSLIGGNDIIKSGGNYVAFFDKYAYNDYSKYVISLDVKRNLGQYPYGTFMAQADIELDNSSLLFLPGHDATIGSGIVPNRPLKLALGFNGEYMQQFVGFTQQPKIDQTSRVATFHAFDAFNYIAGFLSQASGAYVGFYAQQIMAALMGEMGFGQNQYVFDQSLQQPIGYISTFNQLAGDIFQQLCEAEQGLAFADEGGIVRFWNRQHFTTTSGSQAFKFNFSNINDLQYEDTPIINDVEVTAKPRSVQANQKVWELSGTITLLPNQQTLYIVGFTDNDGALPCVKVDPPVPQSSSTTSYFAANSAPNGTGIDYSGQVAIASAYGYGSQYWITFSNTTNQTLYVTAMGIFGTPAKVTQQIDQRYFDQASINTYGRNPSNNGQTIQIANDYIQDPSTANSLARTLVYEYKDPHKRYLVPIGNGSDPSLQIGDYGILHIDDTGEDKKVWIVGIEEQINRGGQFTAGKYNPSQNPQYGPQPGTPQAGQYMQILELEERAIQQYFTIGQSLIGSTDAIAP